MSFKSLFLRLRNFLFGAHVNETVRRFRELADNIDEVIWIQDLELGKVSYVSKSFEQIWGISYHALIRQPGGFLSMVHPSDRARVAAQMIEQPLGTYREEYRILRSDRSERWISDRAFPIKDSNGKVIRIVGLARDITKHKNSELALRQSEQQFRSYFEQPIVGIAFTAPDMRLTFANQKLCEMLGYALPELRQKGWIDITHPEDVSPSVAQYRRALNGEIDRYSIQKRYIRRDGTILHAIVSVGAIRKISGELEYFICVIQDISAQKRVEHQLREHGRYLQEIIDTNPNLIFVKDQLGTYQLVNLAFAAFYGKAPEQIVGLSDQDLPMLPGQADKFRLEDQRVLRSGVPYEVAGCAVVDALGETRWFRSVKAPLEMPDGKSFQILGVSTEITDIKRMEAQKEQLATEAAVAGRLASLGELAAGVAHEINNPLTGMINYAQLVIDSQELSAQNNDYLKDLISEGVRIAGIVSGLLKFSRIEEKNKRLVAIENVLRASINLFGSQFKSDGIQIDLSVAQDLPLVECIPQEIQQVFVNLISNARHALNSKFPQNDPNKCFVVCILNSHLNGQSSVRCEFQDYGMGIPDDIKSKIFDPFFTTKRNGEGTGLGLSISYGIIEKHGGQISFESRYGEYTKAIIEIPVRSNEYQKVA